MKYIKTFEDLQSVPQIDDYVVAMRDVDYDDDSPTYKEYKEYIGKNVGQVIKKNNKYLYVYYENIPEKFNIWLTNINIGKLGDSKIFKIFLLEYNRVAFFSKNKEDCEKFLYSQKYNI